jgi:ATP-dependent Zn protease
MLRLVLPWYLLLRFAHAAIGFLGISMKWFGMESLSNALSTASESVKGTGTGTSIGGPVTSNAIQEIAYSTFLRLLDSHPSKIQNLQFVEGSNTLLFDLLDTAGGGASQPFMSRIVSLPSQLVEKLLTAKLPFQTIPSSLSSPLSPSSFSDVSGSVTDFLSLSNPQRADTLINAISSMTLQKLTHLLFHALSLTLKGLLFISLPMFVLSWLGGKVAWMFTNEDSDGDAETDTGEDRVGRTFNSRTSSSSSMSSSSPSLPSLSFANDIAGLTAAKQEVQEVITLLSDKEERERYRQAGARVPCGILLVGPPGSGKTLLARISASTANVPFISVSGSEFMELYVGRGPARVRKLFQDAMEAAKKREKERVREIAKEKVKAKERARLKENEQNKGIEASNEQQGRSWRSWFGGISKENRAEDEVSRQNEGTAKDKDEGGAKAIIFIDEIDSIGRSRGGNSLLGGFGVSNDEQQNTLNQLLTSMDGLESSNQGIVVMAATNR